MSDRKRICFVCLGNIVRSPLAEHLFRHLVEQAGLAEKFQISSAATANWHVGDPPDPRMVRTAARHGLIYDGRGRQFLRQDFQKYDLVITMDASNVENLREIAPDQESLDKIHLLREFDPQGGPKAIVPDPYYGGLDGFEEVYLMVERSCQGLLERLQTESERKD